MAWNIILEKLKDEMVPDEFNKYIKNLQFDEKNSTEKTKIFIASNVYVLQWIKRNYVEKIALLFEREIKDKPEIKIKISSKESEKSTKYDIKIIQSNQKMVINPSFTFNTFVVGNTNKVAFTVAKEAAQKPGSNNYNPIFICGDTGVGKTHLLHAVANYNINKKNIILLTSEDFTNDFIYYTNKQNSNSFHKFREKYRNCDFLLIDDVQGFSGKKKTQEEFFNTFNALKENNKQIILTSNAKVEELDIENRLKSRFESGLIAEIQHPELKTKIEIIKYKCKINDIRLNDEIINYIAANINDVRRIEGIITTINTYASIINQSVITFEFAKNIINSYKRTSIEHISIDKIIEITSRMLNIKPSDIKTKKRTKEAIFARKIVIYLARKLTKKTMPEIALLLGMRDHSSISKTMKNIEEEIQSNKNFKMRIEEIESKIKIQK